MTLISLFGQDLDGWAGTGKEGRGEDGGQGGKGMNTGRAMKGHIKDFHTWVNYKIKTYYNCKKFLLKEKTCS